MQLGTFPEAILYYVNHRGEPVKQEVKLARLEVHSAGFTQVTHYVAGVRTRHNKRTLVLPTTHFRQFEAKGYSGSLKELAGDLVEDEEIDS